MNTSVRAQDDHTGCLPCGRVIICPVLVSITVNNCQSQDAVTLLGAAARPRILVTLLGVSAYPCEMLSPVWVPAPDRARAGVRMRFPVTRA